MPKKALPTAPPVLHELSSLLEFRPVQTLQDGTLKGQTSVFLVEARRCAVLDEPPLQCVLKIYHTRNKALNNILYDKELAVNSILSHPWAAPGPDQAVDNMFRHRLDESEDDAPPHSHPQCFGLVSVREESLGGAGDRWRAFSSERKRPLDRSTGFLFEFLADIRPMRKADVNPDRAAAVMAMLDYLHASNIRHGNLEDPSVYPDVGFANMFVRDGGDDDDDDGNVFILDFNRARLLSDSQADQDFLKDEQTRMRTMLDSAMSDRDPWEDLPRETRRLLGR
jgi:hypothetical protein